MSRVTKVTTSDNDTHRLRRAILKVLPEVLQRLYYAALDGDTQAAKLLLERALPALTPVRDAVMLNGDTPAEWKADLLAKVAGGEIAPRDALALLELIERIPAPSGKPPSNMPERIKEIRELLYGKE